MGALAKLVACRRSPQLPVVLGAWGRSLGSSAPWLTTKPARTGGRRYWASGGGKRCRCISASARARSSSGSRDRVSAYPAAKAAKSSSVEGTRPNSRSSLVTAPADSCGVEPAPRYRR